MTTVWRGADSDSAPVRMECERFGHPHKTMTGETMYINTHFLTEEQAWESIRVSCEVAICRSGEQVTYAQSQLASAKEKAPRATLRMAAYIEARNKRTREVNRND